MTRARDRSQRPAAWAIVLALGLPALCHAEAYGPPDPRLTFVLGLVFAVPTALACVLGEVIRPRRLLPGWLTIAAGLTAVATLLLALHALRMPPGSFLFGVWLAVPACATVALRGAVPQAWVRLAAGWLLALAMLWLVAALHPQETTRSLLTGSALTCLLAWSTALGLIKLLRAVPDVPASHEAGVRARSIASALARGISGTWHDLRAACTRLSALQSSLAWWLGSAALLYVGLGALMASGLIGMLWFEAPLAQLQDLFGLRLPHVSKPIQVWWSYYGLGWSLLVGGAVWALAATLRLLEPGRGRVVRLPALVFGLALAGWTVFVAVRVAEIQADEARAAGLRR